MTVSGTAPKIASKEQLFSHSVEHGHTYRVIEVVGTSEKGIDDAIRAAIDRAHRTIRALAWCEVARAPEIKSKSQRVRHRWLGEPISLRRVMSSGEPAPSGLIGSFDAS